MAQLEAVLLSAMEISGSDHLSAVPEATKVYEWVRDSLLRGEQVVLSFDGMVAPTTAYFSTAVGQLYGDFDEPFLTTHLRVYGLDSTSDGLLQAAIRYAKYYYADPEGYVEGLKEAEADYSDDD